MDAIAQIKTLKDEQGLSFREISRQTGLARKTVRKWYYSKEYPKYSRSKTSSPKKDSIVPYLKMWIEEDKKRMQKERKGKIRPASVMCHDLKDLGIAVGESTVRRYLQNLKPKEVFIPLAYEPGQDMQVDWGELKMPFRDGKLVKVYFFVATLPYSNSRFAYPYFQNDWLSFVDGHVRAFEFFGGIPQRITYDNLSSAVKRVLSGIHREEQDNMLYFKTYYNIQTNYCAKAKGNEKGSVENGVGFLKRRLLAIHEELQDFDSLRDHLSKSCLVWLETLHYQKRSQKIRELLEEERKYFSALSNKEFEASKILILKSNKSSQISYAGVKYSIPCAYCSKELKVKVSAFEIVIYNSKGEEIAKLKRVHRELLSEVYDFRHYLDVLLEKSRALDQAKCIKQSEFPQVFWDYLSGLKSHEENGNREMVRILMLEKDYSLKEIFFAMEWCLNHRSFSYSAIKLTLSELTKESIVVEKVLKEYPVIEEEQISHSKYDQLIGVN